MQATQTAQAEPAGSYEVSSDESSSDEVSSIASFLDFVRDRASLSIDERAADAEFERIGLDSLDLLALTLAVADLGVDLTFAEVCEAATLRSVLDLSRRRMTASAHSFGTADAMPHV